MTFVPVRADEVLAQPAPISADLEACVVISEYLSIVQTNARSYFDAVQVATQELTSLRGDSVARLRQKLCERLLPGAQTVEQSAHTAKSAIDDYASEAAKIHRRAEHTQERVQHALNAIQESAGEIERISRAAGIERVYVWNERVPLGMPTASLFETALAVSAPRRTAILESGFEWAWRWSALRWNEALDTIDEASLVWRQLVADRNAVEQTLVSALRSTELGHLIRVGETSTMSTREVIAFAISGELRGLGPVTSFQRNSEIDSLLAAGLTTRAMVEWWRETPLTAEQIAGLPPATLVSLAHVSGVPAWAQHVAATALLHYAITSPREAFDLMGFDERVVTLEQFRAQLLDLHRAWQDSEVDMKRLNIDAKVQFIGLSNHDGALTAAISHGDLDTASHLGINVPGMFSGASTLGNDSAAARSILYEAMNENPGRDFAVVAWAGYRSPNLLNVNGLARAESGGHELAEFLTGVWEGRSAPNEIVQFTIYGHSYGSTTSAEALKMLPEHVRIDDLVVYGSAGFADGTERSQLSAAQIYSIDGPGDNWAWAGRTPVSTHSVHPAQLSGTIKLSAGGGGGYLRVSSHSMFTEDSAVSLGNWLGHVGYTTPDTRSVQAMGKILAKGGME